MLRKIFEMLSNATLLRKKPYKVTYNGYKDAIKISLNGMSAKKDDVLYQYKVEGGCIILVPEKVHNDFVKKYKKD